MNVVVNGTSRVIGASATVQSLISVLVGPEPAGIAVAVNGTVVPRGDWTVQSLQDGDAVEVLTAVQGG
jgi:sulfur carrier protein